MQLTYCWSVNYFSVGTAALPLLWKFLGMYNCPQDVLNANTTDIAQLLNPLGLHNKRAHIIKQFSSKSTKILS